MHSGFAAGCEAGLCPAVQFKFANGLRPRFGLCPKGMGQRPNQGPSPNLKNFWTAGQSPASHPAAKPELMASVSGLALIIRIGFDH